MRGFLVFCFAIFSMQTACVSVKPINPQGFTHKALEYRLPLAHVTDQAFVNDNWIQDDDNDSHMVESKSISGATHKVRFKSFDLAWKHRETKGVIAIQSFPLEDLAAKRKLAILAKDFADHLSGGYFYSFGRGAVRAGIAHNFVTNVLETKVGMMGTAETYEAIVEVADAEQMKLNPQHRLQKYKMLLIRPRAEDGWQVWSDTGKLSQTYPALIVVTYAMDFAYYNDYIADFDSLVSRLKLRN